MARPRLLGSETPRVFTPPLRPLTPETSLGFSVIEFAEILGVELLPWQRWLLIHALELREDGTLRFRHVVVLVARQNGKSTVSVVLALWWLFVCGVRLVLGTAQDLDTAEEVWGAAVDLAEENAELAEMVRRVVRVNGKKSLDLVTGERYKVKAANRKAGRGLSGDRVILDELREHESWDSWAAITKTTRARADAQIWCFSNAGDARSIVLAYLRKTAHRALGDPDGICRDDEAPMSGPTQYDVDSFGDDDLDDVDVVDMQVDEDDLGLFEWSAHPNAGIWDRGGWAQSNPALGYLITERTMASEAREPERVFRPESLCQWLDSIADGPFPPGSWEQGTNAVIVDPDGTQSLAPGDRIVGPVVACVDQSHDRSQTWIAFGGRRPDGQAQVEVVAGRHGTEWVRDWLLERSDRVTAVTGQTKGAPVSSLMKRLKEDAEFTIEVVDWTGGDLIGGHGEAFDAVRDVKVRHNPQPVLDQAAASAVLRQLGEGAVIDRRRSPTDAAPLVAFEGALWLLSRPMKTPPPQSPPPRAVQTTTATATGPARGSATADLSTIGF